MKNDLIKYLDKLSKQYKLLRDLAALTDEENEEEIFEELKYMLYEIEAKYNAKKKKPLPAPTDNDLDEELCHQQYITETEDCQA